MDKNIEISVVAECDTDWLTYKQYFIIFSGSVVGYVKTFTFTKERIDGCMEEDYAFYMNEGSHIREDICNLMYEHMGDAKITYIDEFFLEEEYRGKGIGSIVLKEIENLNTNCAFMLLAGALEKIHEFWKNEDYRNELTSKLLNFYENNGYNHHGTLFYKGIDFSEENWIEYDNYDDGSEEDYCENCEKENCCKGCEHNTEE